MDTQLIIGLILTVTPIFELRGGLPVVIDYCMRTGAPIIPYFLLVLALNIALIFVIFFFLDFIHETLMKFKPYKSFFGYILRKIQKKANKLEKKMEGLGYIALMFLVAIPLPGTGAWTGTLLAWLLGLDRSKSLVAIISGVIIAGLLILLLLSGLIARV